MKVDTGSLLDLCYYLTNERTILNWTLMFNLFSQLWIGVFTSLTSETTTLHVTCHTQTHTHIHIQKLTLGPTARPHISQSPPPPPPEIKVVAEQRKTKRRTKQDAPRYCYYFHKKRVIECIRHILLDNLSTNYHYFFFRCYTPLFSGFFFQIVASNIYGDSPFTMQNK